MNVDVWRERAGQDICVEVVARRSGAERMKALVWRESVAQEQRMQEMLVWREDVAHKQRMKVLVRRECVVQEK